MVSCSFQFLKGTIQCQTTQAQAGKSGGVENAAFLRDVLVMMHVKDFRAFY